MTNTQYDTLEKNDKYIVVCIEEFKGCRRDDEDCPDSLKYVTVPLYSKWVVEHVGDIYKDHKLCVMLCNELNTIFVSLDIFYKKFIPEDAFYELYYTSRNIK